MKSEWEVDKPAKCVSECGHIKEQDNHEIVISKQVWHVIQAMLRKFPEHEWQMMLTGSIEKDTCYCTGYYVTKQKVSGGLVTNLDCVDKAMIDEKHIVAGIHSHVNMMVSPSGTDINDSVMSLIDYHMIVNNKLDMNGMRKAQLPCGKVSVAKCDVLIEDELDLDAITIEGIERIEKQSYVTCHGGCSTPAKWDPKNWDKGTYAGKYEKAMYRDYDAEYDADVIKQMQMNGAFESGYGY